ncbi:hypothetical protein F4553_005555 [Allocatelliglobosispora scoriae]|uniref:Uncharacterized protein n=1 Tax=Allocatelliglobosispora scoriae TaxID=643052 RepID=A0A841BZN6_9ACTN|nr:DUF6232 family protein [Allocatelliglobosispora scoriae]MBB5872121.1 hypothetical protein [Allocatelliglobosispora scoriae]
MTENSMENRQDSASPTSDVLLSLPGIRITTSWLMIADRRYSVLELRDLRTQRGPFDPVTTRAGLATMIGIALLGATVRSLPPIGLLGAVIAITALAAITAITAWRRPRGYTLWAESHGLMLQLYYSDDQRIFGHVCRTLMRARERAFDAAIPNPPHYGRRLETSSVPHPSTLSPTTTTAERARNIFTRAG